MSTVAFSVWVTFVPKSQTAFGNIVLQRVVTHKRSKEMPAKPFPLRILHHGGLKERLHHLLSHCLPMVFQWWVWPPSVASQDPGIEGFSATITLTPTSQFEGIVRTDTGSPKRQWVKDGEGTRNFPDVYLIFVRTHRGQCIHTCKQRHSQLIWYMIQISDEI